ncbi:MAG: UbiD family decarboxylase [Oscillospiraceae bacterium]|nr:UbiD family decarboxylase [Oscillospiraceae bacterium]
MAYKDMREFLQKLEAEGELLHVKQQVDWKLEMGAVSRRLCDLETKGINSPAVIFDNIKDYPGGRFFTNSMCSFRRYALALGLDKDTTPAELVHVFQDRINNPIPPVEVSRDKAPCKENILTGDDIDLTKFPVPIWHEFDGHRYIGTFHAAIMRDRNGPWVNWGMYRACIHDKNTMGLNIPAAIEMKNGPLIHRDYVAKEERMPVVLAMGDCPTLPIVAAGMFPVGCSEVEMAGGLRQAPYELVKAETCDLMVPANAEIIIEGYIEPHEVKMEGPFGEYTGYYGGREAPKPVIHVTCVTHRNDPILIGSQEGVPFVDDHYMCAISMSALARNHLINTLNIPGVKDVYFHPAANWNFCVVSMTKTFDGAANTIAHALWSSKIGYQAGYADWIIVVDDDVDPSDINQVLWSLVTRCNPYDDIHMVQRKGGVNVLNPNIHFEERMKMRSASGICIDAAWPWAWRAEEMRTGNQVIPPTSNWEDWPEHIRERALEIVQKELGK